MLRPYGAHLTYPCLDRLEMVLCLVLPTWAFIESWFARHHVTTRLLVGRSLDLPRYPAGIHNGVSPW